MASRRRAGLLALAAVSLSPAAAAARSDRPPPALLVQARPAPATGYAPRFLYDSDHFATPYVEAADRSLFDVPTARRTARGVTVDRGTFPGTQDGGSAAAEFQRFSVAGKPIAVVDSFARPFAYLVQDAKDPEEIEVLTERGEPYDATWPGPRAGNPDAALGPADDPTQLYVQGLGCMADPALHAAYAIVGMQSGNATAPGDAANPPDVGVLGHQIGIRGFVAVGALPARVAGQARARLLARHDVGCAPRDLRVPPGADGDVSVPEAQPWDRFADVYLGARSWRACPDDGGGRPDPEAPGCGTPYAQYQSPPGLTPPGDGVSLLTANTTGVTGIHAGVVRALYRAGAFRVVDEIGYADPNVPCAPDGGSRDRTAHWVFGDANPHPAHGQTHIWGWRVERVGVPPGGDWPALVAGSSLARRCGTAAPMAPPARARIRRCPPAGARVLRRSGEAAVYATGAQLWVCDRASRHYEELDDTATGERVQRGAALDLAGRRLVVAVRDRLAERPRPDRVLELLDVAAYAGAGSRPASVLEAPLAGGVGSARVYRSGAAYIACTPGPPRDCRVHVVTAGAPPPDRVVASGPRIVAGSLRVRHGRLHWAVRR